jgi:hypothetical protein
MELQSVPLPASDLVLRNCAFVGPEDFRKLCEDYAKLVGHKPTQNGINVVLHNGPLYIRELPAEHKAGENLLYMGEIQRRSTGIKKAERAQPRVIGELGAHKAITRLEVVVDIIQQPPDVLVVAAGDFRHAARELLQGQVVKEKQVVCSIAAAIT